VIPATGFRLFKYLIYALLSVNVALFFKEEWDAAQAVFLDGISADRLIEAFAATIDTAAWVVMLGLFEIETAMLSAARLQQPSIERTIHGTRVVAAGLILYACYGYLSKWLSLLDHHTLATDPCELVTIGWSLVESLDQYQPLTPESCQALQGTALVAIDQLNLIGSVEQMTDMQRLALVDVINSIAWIGVVVILELDVRLQLRGRYTGRALAVSAVCKALLYSALVGAAVYWGMLGDFLDFWDAFLWLVAFVFIEINVFRWGEARSPRASARVA